MGAQASNARANDFTIIGSSNGALMTNFILIVSGDARIHTAIAAVTQLTDSQYLNGNFIVDGTVKSTLTKRKFLQITGARDTMIPAEGGSGFIEGLEYLHWQESAFAYAQGYGYSGAEASVRRSDDGSADFVSYPDATVEAYNFLQATHGWSGVQAVRDKVISFLGSGSSSSS